jgi:hypothetical protein
MKRREMIVSLSKWQVAPDFCSSRTFAINEMIRTGATLGHLDELTMRIASRNLLGKADVAIDHERWRAGLGETEEFEQRG